MNENCLKEIEDIILHKKYVYDSCLKMCKFLINERKTDLALDLMRRAAIHDNSKLEKEELCAFLRIDKNNNSLKNPYVELDTEMKNILETHWRKNRHHPEYFEDYLQMEELDIIEMCCDWHARSTQYGTDLLEFVRVRQENRFKFEEKMYEKILNYCNILVK